ncbi:MAG: hypothetical protein M1818_000641 [Claussenomyces sp. TS43310]|nr:MAG: hypothetical protein M1818_000641 [Claussenomyces sp. TS43310]
MPKGLEKTRKKITKKKGNITALHENSRDSQRLRRAAMRDDKLQRVGAARRKVDQPQIMRTAFFQECARKNENLPLELVQIQKLIEFFVNQNDEEYDNLKKQRRPGRPPTTREDLLKMKIAADKKEFEHGFCQDPFLQHLPSQPLTSATVLPDLSDADNTKLLDRWDGTWSYLPTLKWVRISKAGLVQSANFPPKG